MPRVVAAMDKFRGTATAAQATAAVASAARASGWACDEVPLSDGGEGFSAILGGRRRTSVVHGPLGEPVEAEWRLRDHDTVAVVEMASGSGLALVGGASGNDPVRADSRGAGELIAEAVKAGARRVLIGVGGSASTDGGLGALDVLEPHSRLRGVELIAACDVTTGFTDAARVFGPQKGASPAVVELLTRRLERLVGVYRDRFGVDVAAQPGAGAGGGFAGGLLAIGASLASGFEVVSEAVDLVGLMEGADLVVTGEGYLDAESYHGKAVGGVLALAAELGVDAYVVAGDGDAPGGFASLVAAFGEEAARADPAAGITALVSGELARRGGRAGAGS